MTDDEMRSRIALISEDIVEYREVADMAPHLVQVGFAEVGRLTGQAEFGLLLDLTESRRPEAATRHAIKACLGQLEGRLRWTAAFTGGNPLIAVAMHFVARIIGTKDFSVHAQRVEAIAALVAAGSQPVGTDIA
jgi:hypothetical protein